MLSCGLVFFIQSATRIRTEDFISGSELMSFYPLQADGFPLVFELVLDDVSKVIVSFYNRTPCFHGCKAFSNLDCNINLSLRESIFSFSLLSEESCNCSPTCCPPLEGNRHIARITLPGF